MRTDIDRSILGKVFCHNRIFSRFWWCLYRPNSWMLSFLNLLSKFASPQQIPRCTWVTTIHIFFLIFPAHRWFVVCETIFTNNYDNEISQRCGDWLVDVLVQFRIIANEVAALWLGQYENESNVELASAAECDLWSDEESVIVMARHLPTRFFSHLWTGINCVFELINNSSGQMQEPQLWVRRCARTTTTTTASSNPSTT